MTVLVSSPHSGRRLSWRGAGEGSSAERKVWMVTFSVTQDPSSGSLACDAILQAHDSRQSTRQALEG